MLKSMTQQVLNSLHHEVALALKMACQEYEGQAYAEMDQLVFLEQLVEAYNRDQSYLTMICTKERY